jgi:ATP-binding cassette subfamily B protein
MLTLVRPHLGSALIVLVLIGLQIGIQVAGLNLMRLGINRIQRLFGGSAPPSGQGDGEVLAFLLIVAGAYVALFGAHFLVFNVMRIARSRFSMSLLWLLRNKVYDRLQRLSFRFFDENYSGELINRATGDINTIRRFFMMVLFSIVTLVVYTAVFLVMLLLIRWELALVCMAPLPVSVVLLGRFGRRIRRAFHAVREGSDDMVNALQENVAGVQVVKAFAREQAEIDKYGQRTGEVYGRVLRTMKLFRNNLPLINRISQLSTLIMLFFGGWLIMDGRLMVGDLMLFSAALGRLMGQLRMVIGVTNLTQEAAVSAERVFEILDAAQDVADRPHARKLPPGRGRVQFENVTFGYDPDKPVLEEIDLAVEPGQIVALVGPTGSGKSTLTHLVPRFYDPQQGRVLIDGLDAREVRLRHLRSAVGMVFQETFLFSASIAENIAFGVPEATDEDIRRAARIARADEFIEQFEDGYETVIGERGVTLSGGQRQRVAIARAVVKDPRILILDDATASVDSATEQEIQIALDEVMRDRTTFVIAHRMSTIRRADRVVVIENGRVSGFGTHAELFARDGHYRELVLLQIRDARGRHDRKEDLTATSRKGK